MASLNGKIEYAPQVDSFISFLGHRDFMNGVTPQTASAMDRLFSLLGEIESCGEDDRKEYWVVAPRGDISAYGSYEEAVEYEEVSSREEFERNWKEDYPDEESWYKITTVQVYNGYRGVFVKHRLCIEMRTTVEPVEFGADCANFIDWLISATEATIRLIKEGTYLKTISERIPYKNRFGTISRKKFWVLFPEQKSEDTGDLAEGLIQTFAEDMRKFNASEPEKLDRIPFEMFSAGEFLKCCSIAYHANDYEKIRGKQLTPMQEYQLMADGRDGGLLNIPQDNPYSFQNWMDSDDKQKWGSHPWEICAGGTWTHISMYVRTVNEGGVGYRLVLSGLHFSRAIEVVKMYFALKDAGYPVSVYEWDKMVDRLTGADEIGIVPDGIWPSNCEAYFEDKTVIDFINLDDMDRTANGESLADSVSWYPLKDTHLSKCNDVLETEV